MQKKVYKYDNKVQAHLRPTPLKKVEQEKESTGQPVGAILSDAVDFYFAHRHEIEKRQKPKNGY